MAIVNGGISQSTVLGGQVLQKRLSGIVRVDGTLSSRQIIAYLVRTPGSPVVTQSAADGTWELVINIGKDDEARVICVGESGENSEIYEHIT